MNSIPNIKNIGTISVYTDNKNEFDDMIEDDITEAILDIEEIAKEGIYYYTNLSITNNITGILLENPVEIEPDTGISFSTVSTIFQTHKSFFKKRLPKKGDKLKIKNIMYIIIGPINYEECGCIEITLQKA